MKKLLIVMLLMSLILLVIGCGGGPPQTSSFQIEHLYWYGDNIDPGYWTRETVVPPTTIFTSALNFIIKYSGNISYQDIDRIVFTSVDTGIWWRFYPEARHFDTSNQISFLWCYYTDSPHTIPIGEYRAEVFLKGGSTSTSVTATFSAPGSTTTNNIRYLYSENYSFSPPFDYDTLLKRAENISVDKTETGITVNFTSDDPRVYDGFLWFFDTGGNYVGSSIPGDGNNH